ncbi:TPA: hypothetical protein DEG21_02540 [Patescibacteria group bacterium]|nr:hypothetical protein [Candidatus Gracilibacteria bacterium]HBY74754.1 hypothetical protein [Candidatus Gracilibacteria bacterium]
MNTSNSTISFLSQSSKSLTCFLKNSIFLSKSFFDFSYIKVSSSSFLILILFLIYHSFLFFNLQISRFIEACFSFVVIIISLSLVLVKLIYSLKSFSQTLKLFKTLIISLSISSCVKVNQ